MRTSPELSQRLAAKTIKAGPDECWNWTGHLVSGYGSLKIGASRERTHRAAYRLAHGSIPVGKKVLHSCDNKRCVNPAHLFAGTSRDNTHDMMAKGRDRFWGRRSLRHLHEEEVDNWRFATDDGDVAILVGNSQ